MLRDGSVTNYSYRNKVTDYRSCFISYSVPKQERQQFSMEQDVNKESEKKRNWKRYLPMMILAVLGAIGGFLYYRFVGCVSGACPITSNPISSTVYAACAGRAAWLYRYPGKENGGTGQMKKVVIIGGVAVEPAARQGFADWTKQPKSCCSSAGNTSPTQTAALHISRRRRDQDASGAAAADAGGDAPEVPGGRPACKTKCSPSTVKRKPCSSSRPRRAKRIQNPTTYGQSRPVRRRSSPPFPASTPRACRRSGPCRIPTASARSCASRGVKSAAVIGGGFVGLEMAENLRHAGLEVSLIEALDQVMSPIDFEMAQLLHETLVQNGVDLHLGDAVESFNDVVGGVDIKLKSGQNRLRRACDPLHRRAPERPARQGSGALRSTRAAASWSTTTCSRPILPSTPWDVVGGAGFHHKRPDHDPARGSRQQAGAHRGGQHRGAGRDLRRHAGLVHRQGVRPLGRSTGENEKTLVQARAS